MFFQVPHRWNPWDAKRAARKHTPSRENCVFRLFDGNESNCSGNPGLPSPTFQGLSNGMQVDM